VPGVVGIPRRRRVSEESPLNVRPGGILPETVQKSAPEVAPTIAKPIVTEAPTAEVSGLGLVVASCVAPASACAVPKAAALVNAERRIAPKGDEPGRVFTQEAIRTKGVRWSNVNSTRKGTFDQTSFRWKKREMRMGREVREEETTGLACCGIFGDGLVGEKRLTVTGLLPPRPP